MSDDYYTILGIEKNASQEVIKKAYHKLALQWHPDKNTSPEATEMFKKISEAYDTLSDPEKRGVYDQFGKSGLNNRGMQFDPGNIFDIFNRTFGGNMPFGMQHMFQNSQQFQQQTQNIEIIEKITLKDVFTGKTIKKEYDRKSLCDLCNASGSDDGKDRTCTMCHGKKIIQQQQQLGMMCIINNIPCPTCGGKGINNLEHTCKKCKGSKLIDEHIKTEYTIPSGCIDGLIIATECGGNIDPVSRRRGNLNVKIELLPHDKFMRNAVVNNKLQIDGYNLLFQTSISLAESLCGFTKVIEHVDGHKVTIIVRDIVKNNDMYIVHNEGLPMKNKTCGNLYVMFSIDYPKSFEYDDKVKLWKILTGNDYKENLFVKQSAIISKI